MMTTGGKSRLSPDYYDYDYASPQAGGAMYKAAARAGAKNKLTGARQAGLITHPPTLANQKP